MRYGIGPGTILQAQVVQTTTGFHHAVMNVFAPQAQFVFHNAAAFDTADHVFDADAQLGPPLVLSFGRW